MSGTLHWQAAEKLARHYTAQWNQPGAPGGAIVLFDAGQLHASCAGGLADLASGAPFTADSVVRYASITKHVFSALALQKTGGAVALDDPLGKHLPQLQNPMAAVTVGQALDMTSGLPDIRENLAQLGVSVYDFSGAAEILQFLTELNALNYPAGSEVSYTNTGYRLVETALQHKGFPFAELVQQHINQPLDIEMRVPETWYDIVPGLVPGYWMSPQGWQLAASGLHFSASGSLTGSARSLAIWLQQVLTDQGPGKGVLSTLAVDRHLNNGRRTAYGLGLARSQLGQQTLWGHGGSHAGYKTYFLLSPQHQAGVVLVTNREDARSHDIALDVMAALLGEALPPLSTDLPDGVYVSPGEPLWLEINKSTATWLGTNDTLYQGAEGDTVTLSAHLPMRLRWTGSAIEGDIGLVSRRLLPAQPDAGDLQAVQGIWRLPEFYGELEVTGNHLRLGSGPMALHGTLNSLGEGRLRLSCQDGLWPLNGSMMLQGDRLIVVTNRSRVLRFQRSR